MHQSARILTPDLREKVLEIKQHLEKRSEETNLVRPMEIEKIRRIHEWMGSAMPEEELSKARKDFYLFFSEHDRRRGTDFLKTFPEMKEFWELCSGTRAPRPSLPGMLKRLVQTIRYP